MSESSSGSGSSAPGRPVPDDELQVPGGDRPRVRAVRRSGAGLQGQEPVHWCIHCRTALAEAEVEYEDHTSPSIYVEFPLLPESAGELASRVPALAGRSVSVLIWTTTPWTIPSNLAIAFHPDFDYAAYMVAEEGNVGRAVIVARRWRRKSPLRAAKTFGEPIARMTGRTLEHIRFQHPLYARPSDGVLVNTSRSTPARAPCTRLLATARTTSTRE